VHSFLEHWLVASIWDALGAGTLTHTAWQLTSPTAQSARQAAVEPGASAELVLEAELLDSLWAAARPKRATMGMKACMLVVLFVNECD
jgi:hypothetical protein